MHRFNAKVVSFEADSGGIIVGLADDGFSPTEYLLFQRDVKPGQQDIRLGLNGIHTELGLSGRERGGYDYIQAIGLRGSTFWVEFTQCGAEHLGAKAVEVQLNLSGEKFAGLKQHLILLVGDEPVLHIQ